MKAASMGFQAIMQISGDGLHYEEGKMQNYENF